MKTEVKIQYRTPKPPAKEKTILAGMTAIDITPPPGMTTSGYSTFADNAVGVRTRLFARVLYLKDKKEPGLALVQTDMLTGSILVHHRVAEMIATRTDIDSGGLLIAGTHTHSGPGSFFGSNFYNKMAASKPGFDPAYTEFLCRRIADAIIEAYDKRTEARIATGKTEIYGVTVNRAFPPYLLNETVGDEATRKNPHAAINPWLYMIRVDAKVRKGVFKPLGAFTTFSIHPNTNPKLIGSLFSGDVTGFVERIVENEIQARYQTPARPVHCGANLTHGDNNANYAQEYHENFTHQRIIARVIADKTLELFASLDKKLKSNLNIRYRSRQVDLQRETVINGISVAKTPSPGYASAGGALGKGRRTPFSYIPPFRPGNPRRIFTRGEQGAKRIPLFGLLRMVFRKKDFPRHCLLQLIQVGDLLIVPLPWEVTMEMGRRIAEKAMDEGRKSGLKELKETCVCDTSNGYFGYLNTPEEYSLQYYEGGSNFYGPNTGLFVAEQAAELAREMARDGSGSDLPASMNFSLNAADFMPKPSVPAGARAVAAAPDYVPASISDEPFWAFSWYDVMPDRIAFHKPLVSVEVKQGQSWKPLLVKGIFVNDQESDMAVIYNKKESREGRGLYEVRWLNPELEKGREYRFRVEARASFGVFYSPAFSG